MNTCTGMIVSVNKMRRFGEGGVMREGLQQVVAPNAISNLLMEGCGRKEHEYDKQTHSCWGMQTTEPQGVQLKTNG